MTAETKPLPTDEAQPTPTAQAAPAAGAVAGPSYGATEFGWTYAHRTLTDGDKRLMALVVNLFGNDHQAFNDLEALIDRAPTPAAQEDSTTKSTAASLAWTALRDLTDPLGEVGTRIMGHVRIFGRRQYEAGLAKGRADSGVQEDAALSDDVLCGLQAAADALEWIAKRERVVGDVIERVDDIRHASRLAAEGYRRIGIAMTAIDSLDAARAQQKEGL